MFVQSNRVNLDGSPGHLPRFVSFSEMDIYMDIQSYIFLYYFKYGDVYLQ